LPDAGIAEITGGRGWPICAGTFPFSGRARRERGGWRVRGRWGFASGIRNATWVACAAVVDAPDGAHDAERVCLVVPAAHVVIEDTWHVDGLRATGSTHYHVGDLFVPDARAFQLEGPPQRGGPMHRLPPLAYLVGDHIGVGLGLARRALDEITAEARGRVRLGSTTATASRGHFEHELGHLDLALRAARALLEVELEGLWSVARSGSRPDPRAVVRARATASYAAQCVVEAALFAHRMSGAGGVLDDGPRRRAVMDALTLTQHIYLNDEVLDAWGRALVEDQP
jgi:alkylation response protein AidB-like acyl-CoA dehydrogenase